MIRTHGEGRVYHGEDAARTAGDLWRDGDVFIVKTTGASYVRTGGAWVQISVGTGTTDHNSLANFDGGTTNEYYHLTVAQHTDLTDGGDTTLHAHDAYIASSLLTARGDIITRNATIPERLALTVPSAPTFNFLGVVNGETQPSWKSASSAPGATAAVLQTKATGELRLGAVLQIVGDTFPTTGAGLELGSSGVYSVIESINRDTSTGMPIYFNYGITGDMVFNAGASNGNVQIGDTANRGTTVSTKALNIFNGTAPVGTLANGFTLYSSGGAPYVMDAAGTARNLIADYLLLAGRAGGQIAYGGTAASETLTLRSTADATKGAVLIADDGGTVGIRGVVDVDAAVQIHADLARLWTLYINDTRTATTGLSYGLNLRQITNPAADSSASTFGAQFTARTEVGNPYNFSVGLRGFTLNVRHQGSGTVATAFGGNLEIVNNGGGIITDAYVLRVAETTNSSGTITNNYGVYVRSQSAGTNNWAIYTNAGLNNLGDQLKIDGRADRIQLIVQAHSTQTANILEIQDSSANVLISANGSGGLIVNEQGNAAGDFRAESDTEANMLWLDASADLLYLGGSTNGVSIAKGGIVSLIGSAIRSPTSGGTGAAGEICWDANYIYVCTAANTWKRVALTGGY